MLTFEKSGRAQGVGAVEAAVADDGEHLDEALAAVHRSGAGARAGPVAGGRAVDTPDGRAAQRHGVDEQRDDQRQELGQRPASRYLHIYCVAWLG